MLVNANLLASNDRLESRMREIRQSGSVGGEPQTNAASLPQSLPVCVSHRTIKPHGSLAQRATQTTVWQV